MEQPKVEPLLQPNRQVMLAHVEHLFGGWLQGCQDGLVELAWTETTPNAAGRYALNRAQLFDTDHLDDLVDMAVRLNATPFCNVYIGAALRKQKTPLFGRCDRDDVLALPALYADLDDAGAVANARHVYGDAKPTLVVLTGMVPHSRAQLWWRLDEPLFEPWSDRLEGIAAALGGDAVSNSDRVMRLAGSVAWPVKPGRVAELTAIVPLTQPGLSEYMPEHLAQVFPFTPGQGGRDEEKVSAHPPRTGGGAFGFASDLIDDHRESYMRDTVLAVLLEWIGTNGVAPAAEELFEAVWPQYSRKVDFTRPGRGADEVMEKCRYTLKRFYGGKLRGMRTLDEAIATWKRKQSAREGAPKSARREREEREREQSSVPVDDDPGPFPATDLIGEPPERRWLVKDWIPENTVTSLYGDGGVGKSLIAQQLAYSVSIGAKWLGLPVTQASVLCVMCEDEREEIHRRHYAIKADLKKGGNPFKDVWLWPRVGYDNLLVTYGKDGKPQITAMFERTSKFVIDNKIGFLIFDTAADLYGGNEIVRSEVNYFLKAVCGRLVREANDAGHMLTVLILAHPSQAGKESGQGFSGNTAWNNGVRARLYLNAVEDGHPDERVLTRKKSNYSRSGDGEQINLIWDKGVLTLMETSDRGQMIRAKERILDLVKSAWDSGEPYLKRRGSPRNLEMKMHEYLRAEGFSTGAISEALREVKDASEIKTKSVNSRYGWALSSEK